MVSEVKTALEEYEKNYQKGLKREANKTMNELIQQLRKVFPKELREQICYELCEEICDKRDPHKLMSRGNGRLPYALDQILWEYLQEQCRKKKMPQLRWTYELYRNNPFERSFDAMTVILQAFEHQECDAKTETLYFDTILSDLDWGSHHFPETCFLSQEQYEKIIEKGHDAIRQRKISKMQTEELKYYEHLYQCYFQYIDDNKKRDFYELCGQAGIKFRPVIRVYYTEDKENKTD